MSGWLKMADLFAQRCNHSAKNAVRLENDITVYYGTADIKSMKESLIRLHLTFILLSG